MLSTTVAMIIGVLLLTLILVIIVFLLESHSSLLEIIIKTIILASLNILTFIIINHLYPEVTGFIIMATGFIYVVTLLIAMNIKNHGAKIWTITNLTRFVAITCIASLMLLGLTLSVAKGNQTLSIMQGPIIMFAIYHFISNCYKMTYEAATLISFNRRNHARRDYCELMNIEQNKEKKNFFSSIIEEFKNKKFD